MSKNALKIAQGLKALTHKQYELMSGTVVPGTVDETKYSCDVLPTGMGDPIKGVMLHSVLSNANGLIQVPADNSDVIIASVDGAGEYAIMKCSDLTKILVVIGGIKMTIESGGVQLNDGSLGGLVKVIDLTTKLNNLETKLNNMVDAWHSFATAYTPGGPVASGLPSSVTDVSGDLILTTRTDIEDTKMTH